jgi:hypothetical protein
MLQMLRMLRFTAGPYEEETVAAGWPARRLSSARETHLLADERAHRVLHQ